MEVIAAVLVGRAAPEALEGGVGLLARLAGIAAGAVGLPQLEEAVGHRIAGAVDDAALDDDRLADRVRGDQVVAGERRQRIGVAGVRA